MGEIKGVLLDAWLRLLKQKYGDGAVNQAMTTLGPDDRALLSGRFLASSWYPFNSLQALRKLTRAIVAEPDPNLVVEIGRFMAHQACTGVYRSLIAKDPVKQVERFNWVEEMLFNNARKLESELTGPNTALVRYLYTTEVKPTAAICDSHLGFLKELMELAGAKNVLVKQVRCAARGDSVCEFSFAWE
ncbi:MAG TPA: 4-vinyl reductase [Blastocatellia bacterium]|nr:4-vinyl reductase [Blastocatellia bacterium]